MISAYKLNRDLEMGIPMEDYFFSQRIVFLEKKLAWA